MEIFDSNLFVQESRKGRPERSWNGEHQLVILSASEGSRCLSREILRFAQDDTGRPIRLFSPDELMMQKLWNQWGGDE